MPTARQSARSGTNMATKWNVWPKIKNDEYAKTAKTAKTDQ